jgi:capsular polysaccharide biosynthesis protein
MQSYENKDEIGIFELIDLIRRNLKFIFLSVFIGLFIASIFSGASIIMNKSTAMYSLTTHLSLTGDEITEQTVTVIVNSFSHSSVISPAKSKLGLNDASYKVIAKRSHSVGILQLIVEGPDETKLTPLSNEVFNNIKPLVESAIPDLELRKLEISTPKPAIQTIKASSNLALNSVLGVLIGGILSVFYVIVVYFMSPYIVKDNELETLFNTKILGRFISNSQKSIIRKLLEVR